MADKTQQSNDGGQYTGTAAAATAAVISAVPGRLNRIAITTLGSAATPVYDNASAASGTILFNIPASPAVGTIYNVQMPAANGIYVGGTTNTSAVTISYSKAGINGN